MIVGGVVDNHSVPRLPVRMVVSDDAVRRCPWPWRIPALARQWAKRKAFGGASGHEKSVLPDAGRRRVVYLTRRDTTS